MLSISKLPETLRGLVHFLEGDERPTALLCPTDSNVVYRNCAFKELGLDDYSIRRLLKGVDDTARTNGALGGIWSDVYRPDYWRLLPVVDGYKALVYHGVAAPENKSNGSLQTKPATIAPGSDEPLNGIVVVDGWDAVRCMYDWTTGPVEGLSPWVEYVRLFDWAATDIGPISEWPGLLRGYAVHIMSHPHARMLLWGKNNTVIYNESCVSLFGDRHPNCLGKPVCEPWADIWEVVEPLINAAWDGKVQKLDRLPLASRRSGFLEETYWDFVCLPMIGFEGQASGLFVELLETTEEVLAQRRRNIVLNLREKMKSAETLDQLWTCFMEALEAAVEDVPFALLYATHDPSLLDPERTLSSPCSRATLAGIVGVAADDINIPHTLNLLEDTEAQPEFARLSLQSWKSKTPVALEHEEGTLPDCLATAVPGRGFGDKVTSAVIQPIITIGGKDVLGVLVVGLNARRPYEDDYKMFIHFLADFLVRAASLISLPQEQRRAQKISDDMNNALHQQLRLITLQAERTEAKFARMAEEAPTGIFVFDTEGKQLYVNDAYLRMLGEAKSDQMSHGATAITWQDKIHPDDLEQFRSTWKKAVEHKMPFTIEHRLKETWTSYDQGQEISGERWLAANAFPEIENDGKVVSIQGWVADISHRKFAESLASRKLEEALENKRQTEYFIDLTSHEMRNPLSAILQSADSIVSALDHVLEDIASPSNVLSPDVVEEALEAAQAIILCAQHQKRIVDDVLTMSKLDASLLVISPDKVQPTALLDKAIRMFEAEIEHANITAKIDIEASYDELKVDWVVLDPSRLLQIIINLLTNAIKFTRDTERKEVTIFLGASYEKPTGKHHGVDFVPTKKVKRAQTPLAHWGDGEDLYLQIAVSDTGSGLTEDERQNLFQRFSQASPKTYRQYGGSGLGLFISRELCEMQGGQIGVRSGNGETTFTFFVRAKRWVPNASAQKTYRPALPRFTSTSASPMVYSRRGSLAPHSPGPSMNGLKRVSSISEEGPAIIGTPKTLSRQNTRDSRNDRMTGEQLHVLVVEDNLINQKIMSQQLRRAGCIVHVANDGLECLAFVEKSVFCKATTELSVILLDLEMPIMDGLTCIKHIRERQKTGTITKHIPVIAVTANARSEQIALSIEAGMDQVVTKPFRIPELLPQMHALVQEMSCWVDAG